MKTQYFCRSAFGLSCAVSFMALSQAQAQSGAKAPSAPKPAPSTEDKVKTEFKDWRYAGAKIGASFARGPLFLLSISTSDDMEKVWKYYLGRVPTENNVPLAYSWEIPGDNTMVGANYTLGSSYAVSLNSAPREGGTIVYQKGTTNIVIEIRARTPEQAKETGVSTDIKLIKMRPLDAPKQGTAEGTPVQGAATPVTVW